MRNALRSPCAPISKRHSPCLDDANATPCSPGKELTQRWRRQVGIRERIANQNGPRSLAVISYLNRGPVEDRYAELRYLTFFALFDERSNTGELVTRFVGVGGVREGDGLRIGGPDLSLVDKDLRLAPAREGRGRRFDAYRGTLLTFALQLEEYLQRANRHAYVPRRRVPLFPALRIADGTQAVTVDLQALPKRQIIKFADAADDLHGRCGVTTFDFYHTKFLRAVQ